MKNQTMVETGITNKEETVPNDKKKKLIANRKSRNETLTRVVVKKLTPRDGDGTDALPPTTTTILDVEDRWQFVEGWSIADRAQEEGASPYPLLTSPGCYRGLVTFFQNAYKDPIHGYTLAVATESSSHPTGLQALFAQPWVWAGGGLGNIDECPLQVCLAGGTGRDSLTFASACVVSECSASDLLAPDFVERLETASFRANSGPPGRFDGNDDTNMNANANSNVNELVREYVTLHRRIAQVGKFLGTGWVCGEYKVDWEVVPSLLWLMGMAVCVVLSLVGTFGRRRRPIHGEKNKGTQSRNPTTNTPTSTTSTSITSSTVLQHCSPLADQDDKMNAMEMSPFLDNPTEEKKDACTFEQEESSTAATSSSSKTSLPSKASSESPSSPFWSAWDMSSHCRRLVQHRPDTASLDGLKVMSILWIIAAHVMAIQSSTGAGYLNPKNFLPPHGVTSTLFGQLLFSSRYAVDTFLCISGYLAVYVLKGKFQVPSSKVMTSLQVMGVLMLRIIRILPLYGTCLGFWMFVAPHLGGGPFWYQWENFLQPCRDSWWTNLLFVNNFLPWGVSTTANCFYHSWYLAVDVQLFFLFAPWLVLLFHRSRNVALNVTVALWTSSVFITAVLSYTQKWSVNTFDGASVALFDVEGYAKPHVRAQSYLAGIMVAMVPRRRWRRKYYVEENQSASSKLDKYGYPLNSNGDNPRRARNEQLLAWTTLWRVVTGDTSLTVLALTGLVVLSLVTVTGAYVRRACTFEELPAHNDCGSIWSPMATFLYTALSRAVWSICIALLMHLCLEPREDDGKDESLATDTNARNNDGPNKSLVNRSATAAPTRRMDRRISPLLVVVRGILSCAIFTPLAHLSFGAYLIHPIIIFIWKLGGREKVTFRLLTFFMDYCSVTVVTFLFSFVVTLVVEFPFGTLLRPQSSWHRHRRGESRISTTIGGGLVDDTIVVTGSISEQASSLSQSTSPSVVDGERTALLLESSTNAAAPYYYDAVRI